MFLILASPILHADSRKNCFILPFFFKNSETPPQNLSSHDKRDAQINLLHIDQVKTADMNDIYTHMSTHLNTKCKN